MQTIVRGGHAKTRLRSALTRRCWPSRQPEPPTMTPRIPDSSGPNSRRRSSGRQRSCPTRFSERLSEPGPAVNHRGTRRRVHRWTTGWFTEGGPSSAPSSLTGVRRAGGSGQQPSQRPRPCHPETGEPAADSSSVLRRPPSRSATHRRPHPTSRAGQKRTRPGRARSSLGSGSGGLMGSTAERDGHRRDQRLPASPGFPRCSLSSPCRAG